MKWKFAPNYVFVTECRMWNEVTCILCYPHSSDTRRGVFPLTAVCYIEKSLNLKPRFGIYYIYIFFSRLVFIMNLHRFPEEFVLCMKNKHTAGFPPAFPANPFEVKPVVLCVLCVESRYFFNN